MSLFSGIGGLERGLELAGCGETVAQCDNQPFVLRVLERHWPDAQRFTDVAEVTAAAVDSPDLLCGGFPCQPVSSAGKKRVQEDERWLWPEFARVIEELRPRFVVAENVRGLRKHGMVDVLRDLARLGYDAEWDLIPAASVGAPHPRHRFFFVAWDRERQSMGRVFKLPPPVSPWWVVNEERLPRLMKHVPNRRDRLTALGNAVVPIVAWYVGLCLLRATADHEPVDAHPFPLAQFKAPAAAPPVEQFDIFGAVDLVEPVDPVDPVDSPATGWTFPNAGRLIDGQVAVLESVVPKIDGKRLWPTPSTREAEWTPAALAATVDESGRPASDPHVRLYHPETGQLVQTGLLNYVRGVDAGLWPEPPDVDLWPTPHGMSGNGDQPYDGHGNELSMAVRVTEGVSKATRSRRRELTPTPTAKDADKSRRSTLDPSETRTSHAGTTLTDFALEQEDTMLVPTPLANSANRTSRQAMTADQWSKPGLEQVAEMLEGILPREFVSEDEVRGASRSLLPTPAASDYKGVHRPGQRRGQLEEAVKYGEDGLWPTPKAHPSGPEMAHAERTNTGPDLTAAVRMAEEEKLLPTPQTTGGNDRPRSLEKARERADGGFEQLADAALIADADEGKMETAPLSPEWVTWLMGFPANYTLVDEPE